MIVASNLVKSFESQGKVIAAVRSVSFRVAAGEVYGLLGPNGAGKTTTLRMVMGLLSPDEGYVEVGGIRSALGCTQVRQQLGMISTNDGVYPWLSVREMLLYFADLYGVEPRDAKARLYSMCEMLGIQNVLDQRCSTLSTGQRQRVILARGVMHDPPVVLMDEPTRGLDVVGSRTIFQFIDHVRRQGKAVLISTHRLDEAERICDRFGLLHFGRLRHEGTLQELRESTQCTSLTDMFIQLLDRESPVERPEATPAEAVVALSEGGS